MLDTKNKLWYGNNYYHWKILNLFSNSNPNPNPTHLPKHQTLSTNHQFSQRIWYVEYFSVHAHMAWSQKFRKSESSLDTGVGILNQWWSLETRLPFLRASVSSRRFQVSSAWRSRRLQVSVTPQCLETLNIAKKWFNKHLFFNEFLSVVFAGKHVGKMSEILKKSNLEVMTIFSKEE